MSSIEWTNETWNPVTGCTQVSQGCKECYAKKMHKRLQGMGQEKYKLDFNIVKMHDDEIRRPKSWKKPRIIFVNSMSDLFHKDVTDEFIYNILHTIADTPRHTYQILTKRAERLVEFERFYPGIWPPNLWLGVSVENMSVIDRIKFLTQTTAKIKFLSCEPLLGPLDLTNYLPQLDWIIVGGESGPKSKIRKLELDWARDIRDQCKKYGVSFFFKQTGTLQSCEDKTHDCKGKGCKYLDGQLYQEYPNKIKQTTLEDYF